MESRKVKYIIHIIGYTALLCLFFGLFFTAVAPSGEREFLKEPGVRTYFISDFSPKDRVLAEKNDRFVKIISDPVYFTLRTPREYGEAAVTIELNIPDEFQDVLPIAQIGIMRDPNAKSYELYPFYNKKLDRLEDSWYTVRDSGLVLYQKNKRYASVRDFLSSPPPVSKVAVYNYNLAMPFILPDYNPADHEISIPSGIRGGYEIWAYIKDENLDFRFDFYDLNRNKEEDAVKIQLLSADKVISEKVSSDNSPANDNSKISSRYEVRLNKSGLSEGVYKLKINAGDEIITSRIVTKQSRVAFSRSLWIVDPQDYGIKSNVAKSGMIYTDSDEVFIKTTNPASLQTLKSGSSSVEIKETFKQFSMPIAGAGVRDLEFENSDLILAGNGTFSFTKESFFNPSLIAVDKYWEKKKDGVEFVIAKYEPPRKSGRLLIASAEIELKSAYRENGAYGFLLSIPGLSADEPGSFAGGYAEIGKIRIKLSGDNLYELLKSRFKKLNILK